MHKRATSEIAASKAFGAIQQEKQIPRDQLAAALELEELDIPRIISGSEVLSAGMLVLFMQAFDVSWDEFHAKVLEMMDSAETEVQ